MIHYQILRFEPEFSTNFEYFEQLKFHAEAELSLKKVL